MVGGCILYQDSGKVYFSQIRNMEGCILYQDSGKVYFQSDQDDGRMYFISG